MNSIINASLETLYSVYFLHQKDADKSKLLDQLSENISQKTEEIIRKYIESSVQWKVSEYSIIQKDKYIGWHIYNSLYNSLTSLSDIEYKKLVGMHTVLGKSLRIKFIKAGLLVPSFFSEKEKYKDVAIIRNREKSDYASFNIATTLKCNARCAYCYEKGVRQIHFMDDQYRHLFNFFDVLHSQGKKTFNLTWYGGEPLMNQSLIDAVAERLTSMKYDFSSYLITNGSLLTEELVEIKFEKWRVKDVQISLDGLPSTYEKIKRYSSKENGIFYRILDNVDILEKAGIKIHIRLNVDDKNCSEMIELVKLLQERFSDKDGVSYYPAFLTGVNNKMSSVERLLFVKDLLDAIDDDEKMRIKYRLSSPLTTRPCMINDPNAFTVDVYGNIFSCEHNAGRSELALGNLEDFSFEDNLNRLDYVLDEKCEICRFLPKCGGGCSFNKNTGDELCMIIKYIVLAHLIRLASN